jgi:hypothetical protein
MAVDERFLKRAIKWKYRNILNENNIEDENMINRLTNEYMDKLFLCGIKLEALTDQERREIFSAYTGYESQSKNNRPYQAYEKIDTVNNNQEIKENRAEKTQNTIMQNIKHYAASAVLSIFKTVEKPENTSNYHIEESEYKILSEHLSALKETTPRQLRILYYRYLLCRNLICLTLEEEYLRTGKYLSFLPYILVQISNEKYGGIKKESGIIEELLQSNHEVEKELLSKLLNVIKMVVAY